MLIWQGWGIMVIVIAVVAILLGDTISQTLMDTAGLAYGPSHTVGVATGGILSAIGIMLFANWRESKPSRVLVDQATGQKVEVGSGAGTLFFIPSRVWAWIILAFALIIAFTVYDDAGPRSY